MYFGHIHTPTQLLPDPSCFPAHSTLCPLKNIQFNLCCTYALGYRAIHWDKVDLPGPSTYQGPSPLIKTDFPSSSRYQLPIYPQLGVLHHACLSSPCCDFYLAWPHAALRPAVRTAVSWCMQLPLCLENTVSLSSTASGSYSLSTPTSTVIPDKDVPFRAKHPAVSYFLHGD